MKCLKVFDPQNYSTPQLQGNGYTECTFKKLTYISRSQGNSRILQSSLLQGSAPSHLISSRKFWLAIMASSPYRNLSFLVFFTNHQVICLGHMRDDQNLATKP